MTHLTIVAVAQLALIAWLLLDRRREREASAAALASALGIAAAERAELLQRIQAPEQAVITHAVNQAPAAVPALPFDDDEAFHRSREELADALMRGAE